MKILSLLIFTATLLLSGAVFSQDFAKRQKLESNLANIIYCKEYVLEDAAVKPKLNESAFQLCDSAYKNFTNAVRENMSEIALGETERYARVLIDATYKSMGEDKMYMKDFSKFPAEIKEKELPRCLNICNHFAELKEAPAAN